MGINFDKFDSYDPFEGERIISTDEPYINNEQLETVPLFSYQLLNIGDIEECCFKRDDAHYIDYHKYFERIKEISSRTLDDLLDNEKHFRFDYRPKGNLLNAYKKLVGKTYLKPELIPTIGHFDLYTEKRIEGEETKAPRIYFIVGQHAILHILFFDLFHELNPTNY